MKAKELIEVLEQAVTENGDNDCEVRLAHQPRLSAFEYSVSTAAVITERTGMITPDEAEPCRDTETNTICYIAEGTQLGYLPEAASDELGW